MSDLILVREQCIGRTWRVPEDAPCYVVEGVYAFYTSTQEPWTVTPMFPTIPARKAALQVWPCYVQIAEHDRAWPLCIVDPNADVLRAEQRAEKKRLKNRVPRVLTALDETVHLRQRLRCECGKVQSRREWVMAANRPTWDGCPSCRGAIEMPELRLRLMEVSAASCYENTISVRQCVCGCRFELRDWIRFCATHGGCPECGRIVDEEELIGTLIKRRALGLE